jgi:DNA repair ATPase RecN
VGKWEISPLFPTQKESEVIKMPKNKNVSLTDEQFMMLLNGISSRNDKSLNLTEEWSKVVGDNESFAALTNQIHSWVDDEYAKKINEMTKGYEAQVHAQDKSLRKMQRKVDSMEMEMQMMAKEIKNHARIIRKDGDRIDEVLNLKDKIKEFRKNYKQLEEEVQAISKFLKQLTFRMHIAIPGDSLKKATKKLKRLGNPYYYATSAKRATMLPDFLQSEIVDTDYREV